MEKVIATDGVRWIFCIERMIVAMNLLQLTWEEEYVKT